jgi:AcrR family transcriptional regulator
MLRHMVPTPAPVTADAPPSPRERRVAKTRRAIVESARELIDRQGYADTTIDQIADAADIAPRTFFRYFPSKEAVIFADFADVREQLWSLIEDRPADEHPMRSMVQGMLGFADLIEVEHDRLSWGFRVARECPGVADYEISTIKAQTAVRMARFVAERLGVDPTEDPRPEIWSLAVITVFANTMRLVMDPQPGPRRASAREAFLTNVRSVAGAFAEAVD